MNIAARRPSDAGLPQAARMAGALVLSLAASSAWGLDFGHARFVSDPGQPLLIRIPVSGLQAGDIPSLTARPAPAPDWASAGLVPPVPLNTLRVRVVPGVQNARERVLQVQSTQAFSGDLADLLLDVKTVDAHQRYQVSLVVPQAVSPVSARTPAQPGGAASSAPVVGAAATPPRARPAGAQQSIRVRRGDTMLAISQRHAVAGATVYQLMMALQRANPQAFIHHNVNLVRAGSKLIVPTLDDMLSISDREARRQFSEQTMAFLRMQGGIAAGAGEVSSGAAGAVSAAEAPPPKAASQGTTDAVRLTESSAEGDARTAQALALKDAQGRVKLLEDNVRQLRQALQQAQGPVDASESAPAKPQAGTMTPPNDAAAGERDNGRDVQQQVQKLQQTLRDLSQVLQPPAAESQAGSSARSNGPAGPAKSPTPPAGAALKEAPAEALRDGTARKAVVPPAGRADSTAAESRDQVARLADQLDRLSRDLKKAQTAEQRAAEEQRLKTIESSIAELNQSLLAQQDKLASEGGVPHDAARDQAGRLQGQVEKLDQAIESRGETARGIVADGAHAVSNSLEKIAGAINNVSKNANQPIRDSLTGSKPSTDQATASGAASPGASGAAAAELKPDEKAQARVSWLQDHLLGVMTALLALIVLVIAWLLRRANASRDDDGNNGTTAAMVEEKLRTIDLELDPDSGAPPKA